MLVMDASCLYELLIKGRAWKDILIQQDNDGDPVAPHLIDVEVLGLIRRDFQRKALDFTSANIAVNDLIRWPGERFNHLVLIDRAWQLRGTVKTADAFYVALAESLGVPLMTLDRRLAKAHEPKCEFILP